MSDPQIEIAKEWLSEQHGDGRICAHTLKQYIAQLEAELEKAKADSERLIKMLHEWEEHEARYRADSKRLDKLEKALATNQIVSVECGYYDHGSGEGGFFLCDLSDEQLCGHSIREAIDKLEEPDHE